MRQGTSRRQANAWGLIGLADQPANFDAATPSEPRSNAGLARRVKIAISRRRAPVWKWLSNAAPLAIQRASGCGIAGINGPACAGLHPADAQGFANVRCPAVCQRELRHAYKDRGPELP